MGQLTINFTEEQWKAMEYVALSPQEWLQNAWDNRARQAMDEIILNHTEKRPEKLSPQEKIELVRITPIETARQRHEKMMKEMNKK